MRLRTAPYESAASSHAYPVGKRTITLCAGASLAQEIGLTRDRLGTEPIDGFPSQVVLTALVIAALWDDPDVELTNRPAWADNLLRAQLAQLRAVGLDLAVEIHGRETGVLGIDSILLVTAAGEALQDTGESQTTPGTALTSGSATEASGRGRRAE